MTLNQELQNKLNSTKEVLDRIIQENTVLRKKLDQEKQASQVLKSEINGHKQAISDLESTFLEVSHAPSTQVHNISRATDLGEKPKKMKKHKLKFAREPNSEAEDFKNESSLNVSAFTASVHHQHKASAMSNIGANEQFQPAPIVKALVQSKKNEIASGKLVE